MVSIAYKWYYSLGEDTRKIMCRIQYVNEESVDFDTLLNHINRMYFKFSSILK